MEISTTTLTTIRLTAEDVKEIVIQHLKSKGFDTESYSPLVKTVYDDPMDQYGTETFDGINIIANKKENKIEI